MIFGKEQKLLTFVLYCFTHGPVTSSPLSLHILLGTLITEAINLRYVETTHTYVPFYVHVTLHRDKFPYTKTK
jgi:hypothetical protein